MAQSQDDYQKQLDKIRKQVREIKDFYIHLSVYVVVNLFLTILYFISRNDQNTFFWPFWPMFGWGIGLFFHGLSAFVFEGPILTDWEDKEISKRMEKYKSKDLN